MCFSWEMFKWVWLSHRNEWEGPLETSVVSHWWLAFKLLQLIFPRNVWGHYYLADGRTEIQEDSLIFLRLQRAEPDYKPSFVSIQNPHLSFQDAKRLPGWMVDRFRFGVNHHGCKAADCALGKDITCCWSVQRDGLLRTMECWDLWRGVWVDVLHLLGIEFAGNTDGRSK